MATHCSILAWRFPWTERLGGLQSMGSQRVGHDCATKQQIGKVESTSSLEEEDSESEPGGPLHVLPPLHR